MHTETLLVDAGEVRLEGDLTVPYGERGLVVFAHGSGSSRHSPRNRTVAETLQHYGFATLLFDLLTPEEDEEDSRTARLRFDIDLLARRLGHVVRHMRESRPGGHGGVRRPEGARRSVGLFGASTGAAAALVAAASQPDDVAAVVSRGGRPDLASGELPRVRAPTLLIVGGHDVDVLSFNEQAAAMLAVEHDIALVPRATHLFTEPGALEMVSRLASQWFLRHLAAGGTEYGQTG